MNKVSLRRFAVDINWGRAFLALALVMGFGVLMVEPAYAGTAFKTFEGKITTQTGAAAGVAKTVLITGAVLSLIVGLAPMLWGQVKVKWIVTALCACVLFGLASIMVEAFAEEAPAGMP